MWGGLTTAPFFKRYLYGLQEKIRDSKEDYREIGI